MSGDFGSPVVQPVDPNQGINSLSALVGLQSKKLAIQQQQQNLETGQSTQASAKAKATVDTQGAKENQALAQLMADPVKNGLVDRDGNPAPGAQSIIMKVAPTTGSANFGDLVNAARTKVEFDTAKSNLTGAQQAQAGSVIGGASAGAKSPAEVKAITDAYVAQRAAIGDPAAGNFQKIFDAANSVGGHASQQGTGKEAPGQEPWRQTYQNVSRALSLPAAATVGPGGVGLPQSASNAAGVTQNRDPLSGALTAPQLGPGASNPASPTVAGATTRQVQTGNADVDTSNQVVASQRDAKQNIDLTSRIDQLAEVVRPGALAAKVSQGLGALGLQDVNQARTELDKDLARLKGNLASRAQSDTRAGPILDSLPDSSKPTDTIHQAMDVTRGLAKQDLALGKLQSKTSKATGGQMNGFQGEYAHAVSSASPLMHEYLSLSPQQQVEFFKRNFSTKEQARAFRDQAQSVKKLSPDVIGQ